MKFSPTVLFTTMLLLAPGVSLADNSVSVSCSGNGSAVASSAGSYASVNCSGQSAAMPRGVPVTKKFKLQNYSTLSVSGTYNLIAKLGSENSVTITGDSNYLAKNEPTVRDAGLQISGPGNGESSYDIVVLATSLEKVRLSGAGNAEVTGYFPSGLSLKVSGAGNTKLDVATEQSIHIQRSGAGTISGAGSAASLQLEASGAGAVNLRNLKVKNASIEISGAVSLSICASQSATGTITGASSAKVYCEPAERAISTKGSSSVRYR
ncbi:GIN domain-containing protein [Neptunomonas qingdaonensis]|uniref:Putative auto-transporter adhesin, head GIN domain n=1 Tax=Neptunomonas qingdaonensis TaxID=1045558 RepID=A0A1I2R3T1_9GAMM|nr:DUF2807 domain-containing protein [Neptunomonas qingdaonensis]SFG32476.1 Putative auto-transporter adhesin, head GIN domain [Neptunomonas qingdaonensis]